jgi:hypothetical protein
MIMAIPGNHIFLFCPFIGKADLTVLPSLIVGDISINILATMLLQPNLASSVPFALKVGATPFARKN